VGGWHTNGRHDDAVRVSPGGGWTNQRLYGVLAEMEALGLALLEIGRMKPHGKSLEPRDTRSP
jgi:hypothetical protein